MTPAELIKALDVMADAPDGIARMRELVIQVAVCGRLVAQDPLDKPVRVSVARPTHAHDSRLPFAIPGTWAWLPLREVATYNGREMVSPESIATDAWLLDLADIEKDTSRILERVAFGQRLSKSNKSSFRRGDVLYGKLRPYLNKVVVAPADGYCTTEIVPVVPNPELVTAEYLRLSLKRPDFLALVDRLSYGVKMPRLGTADAEASLHPIPPLAEQHRIVSRVEELMGLLDLLEAARAKRETTRAAARDSVLAALREADSPAEVDAAWTRFAQRMDDLVCDPADIKPLRQTVLQLAVRGRLVRQNPADEPVPDFSKLAAATKRASRGSGPGDSVDPLFGAPESWKWLRMDAITDLASGVTKGRNLAGRNTSSLPYLRVANVQAGYLDLEVIKTIDVPDDEIDEGLLLQRGDVLLTEGGDWDKLGRSAVWGGELNRCTHQNHVFRARPLGSMVPLWISMFTNSPDGRAYFQSCAKRTTNLASINMTQLRACPVPVPPVAEQHRIVARVDELTRLLDRLEQRLAAANATQTAFAGAAVHHVAT